jgi:hypothetical protein
MDFLKGAHAVADIRNNTLSLCDNLISVPLVEGINYIPALTIDDTKIPVYSEAVSNTTANIKIRNDTYMLENTPFARCRRMLVARTIFNPKRCICCCHVFNPTDRTIELPARTVAITTGFTGRNYSTVRKSTERRRDHRNYDRCNAKSTGRNASEKQVSFEDCASTGKDFDDLIRLLSRHCDRLA